MDRPDDNYFSLIHSVKFNSLVHSSYSSGYILFRRTIGGIEGFDWRNDDHYDTKYYTIGGGSTWLIGQGGYTTGVDYLLDYNFKKTVGGTAGSISRICLEGCDYNTVVSIPSTVPSGDVYLEFGGVLPTLYPD